MVVRMQKKGKKNKYQPLKQDIQFYTLYQTLNPVKPMSLCIRNVKAISFVVQH